MADMLNLHLQDITASIKTALPALKTCETHTGRFGLAEVQRLAKAAPAVLVSALRYQSQQNPVMPWVATVVVYILTRDLDGLPRDKSSRTLAEYISNWLRGRQFVYGHAITDVDAQNLYATELEKIGISLWGITFKSPLADAAIPPSRGGNGVAPLLDESLYVR